MNKIFIQAFIDGVALSTKKQLNKTYELCFSGNEAVDFLVESGIAIDREQGIKIASSMLNNGVFKHVTNDHGFKDSPFLLYKYTDPNTIPSKYKKSNYLAEEVTATDPIDTTTNSSENGSLQLDANVENNESPRSSPKETKILPKKELKNRRVTLSAARMGIVEAPKIPKIVSIAQDNPENCDLKVDSDSMEVSPDPPLPRMAHSAVIYDHKMWIYGGKGEKSNLNDLMVFSFEKNCWLLPAANGSTPGQRRSHLSFVYNNKMYVFGGYVGVKLANDLHELDFATNTWSRVSYQGSAPPGLYLPSIAVYKHSLYLFGGVEESGDGSCELWKFEFSTRIWEKVKHTGAIPSKRWGHSAIISSDSMFIFGGTNSAGIFFNETFEMTFGNHHWSRTINAPGSKIPSGRYAHNAAKVGNCMFIFGGIRSEGNCAEMHKFSLDTKQWTLVQSNSTAKPSNRSYASCTVYGKFLCIFGGKSNTGYKNTFFKFNITNNIWCMVSEANVAPKVKDPIVLVDLLDPTLVCPVHKGLFVEPVLLSCNHVYCAGCLTHEESCIVCGKSISLDIINPAQIIIDKIKNLKIRCKYGVKLVRGTWVEDDTRCKQAILLSDRESHEITCEFAKVQCPLSSTCTIYNKSQLQHHLDEECPFHKCTNSEIGCLFISTKKKLQEHMRQCPLEQAKEIIASLNKKLEQQEQKIKGLQETIKEKDGIIELLRNQRQEDYDPHEPELVKMF